MARARRHRRRTGSGALTAPVVPILRSLDAEDAEATDFENGKARVHVHHNDPPEDVGAGRAGARTTGRRYDGTDPAHDARRPAGPARHVRRTEPAERPAEVLRLRPQRRRLGRGPTVRPTPGPHRAGGGRLRHARRRDHRRGRGMAAGRRRHRHRRGRVHGRRRHARQRRGHPVAGTPGRCGTLDGHPALRRRDPVIEHRHDTGDRVGGLEGSFGVRARWHRLPRDRPGRGRGVPGRGGRPRVPCFGGFPDPAVPAAVDRRRRRRPRGRRSGARRAGPPGGLDVQRAGVRGEPSCRPDRGSTLRAFRRRPPPDG